MHLSTIALLTEHSDKVHGFGKVMHEACRFQTSNLRVRILDVDSL